MPGPGKTAPQELHRLRCPLLGGKPLRSPWTTTGGSGTSGLLDLLPQGGDTLTLLKCLHVASLEVGAVESWGLWAFKVVPLGCLAHTRSLG